MIDGENQQLELQSNATGESNHVQSEGTEVQQGQEQQQGQQQAEGQQGEGEVTRLYARLSKQDRELRELKTQLKQLGSLSSLGDKAKEDPISAVRAIGVDPYDLARRMFGDAAPKQPEETPEEKIARLEKKLEEIHGGIKSKGEEEQRNIAMYRMTSFAKEGGDKYELINSHRNAGPIMLATAERLYEQNGEVPTLEQVADLVEKHFQTDAEEQFTRLRNTKKFSSVFSAKVTAPASDQADAAKREPGTLANKHSAEPGQAVDPDALPDRENFKYAKLAAMKARQQAQTAQQ